MTASLKEEFHLLDSVELQCSVTGLDTQLRIKTKLYTVLHQPLALFLVQMSTQRKVKEIPGEASGEEGSEVSKVISGREEHEKVGKGPSVPRTLQKGDMAIDSLTVIIQCKSDQLMPVEICSVVINSKVNLPIPSSLFFFNLHNNSIHLIGNNIEIK